MIRFNGEKKKEKTRIGSEIFLHHSTEEAIREEAPPTKEKERSMGVGVPTGRICGSTLKVIQ